jgi:succinate dehydrogenase / fumarate reductase membrane anchor subunit
MGETKLWTWHLIAGVVILALLGLHMLTMHVGELTGLFVANPAVEPTAPTNSMARDSHISFCVGYILLLGVALYHGLYGLRNMLFELTLPQGVEKVLTALLVVIGLGLFSLGTWAAIASHALALATGRG